MKLLKHFILISSLLCMPLMAFSAEDRVKQRMIVDLERIHQTLEIQYAAADWKKMHLNWDLEVEVEKAKQKILDTENITTKQFQYILRELFASTQDLHMGIVFYSTEYSFLPFTAVHIDGRYYVAAVDHEKLSGYIYPVREGAEILAIDDKPIQEVMKEVKLNTIGPGETPTDYALAACCLTQRIGSLGHEIPKGVVMLTLQDAYATEPHFVQLHWTHNPEQVINRFDIPDYIPEETPRIGKDLKKNLTNCKMIAGFSKLLMESNHKIMSKHDDREKFTLGGERSFVPELGKLWWQNSKNSTFHSYLFQTQEKDMIGYLRIPHYTLNDDEMDELQDIISIFESTADALVIDQVNNPGGDLFETYAIASMLTDKPLATPRHRMTLNYYEVTFAAKLLSEFANVNSDEDAREVFGGEDSINGLPITYQMVQFWKGYCHFILEQWNAGKTLTDPYYIWGFDYIYPHSSCRFTKPIVVLVNELDISCGDFFPSIMQENGRALIVGTNTAGAGGYVRGEIFTNRHGIQLITYTNSIAERVNGRPLENLGVTPDVPLKITREDLINEFSGYKSGVLKALRLVL